MNEKINEMKEEILKKVKELKEGNLKNRMLLFEIKEDLKKLRSSFVSDN